MKSEDGNQICENGRLDVEGGIDVATEDDKGDNSDTESATESTAVKPIESKNAIVAVIKQKRWIEKLTFVITLITIVLLAYGFLVYQWLLPYYFAIATPILLLIRFILYFKFKWQYFLLDFCYFVNTITYIYVMVFSWQPELGLVVFSMACGPLPWAVVTYRNSLVPHCLDKMTSVYIHTLPMLMMYSARFHPAELSHHWYHQFSSLQSEDISYLFIWVVAVPLSCFVLHSGLYALFVYGICKPGDKYLYSFRYLKDNGWTSKALGCCGEKWQFLFFNSFNIVFCMMTMLLAVLWYKFYIAHLVYIITVLLIATYNGASFYTDYFAVKGFKEEGSS